VFSSNYGKVAKICECGSGHQVKQKAANVLVNCKGAHIRTSLASESGWARVPMSQTRPCVECQVWESTMRVW
jgi:hypothetical protein